MSEVLSNFLGFLSAVCYVVLYIPQIYNIYKLKISSGFSIIFLILWCTGDTSNLICVALQEPRLTNLLITGVTCSIMTYCLYGFVLYYYEYKNSLNKIYIITTSVILICIQISSILTMFFYDIQTEMQRKIGEVFIWIYMITIISSKFPQIYKNYKVKTIYELSLYLHMFSFLGNSLYVVSILIYREDLDNVIKNIYWIVSGIILALLDTVLITQWLIYYKKHDASEEDEILTIEL